MENKKRADLTEGSIIKTLILFILPLVATSALQQLFNTADMVVVRWFVSDTAYAAVGATGTIIGFFVELFLGFSIGANVVIAKFVGEKNHIQSARAVHTAISFALIGGIVIGLIGLCLARPLLSLTRVPDALMKDAVCYLRIYFAGIPLYLLYNFAAAVFRSVGKNKIPLYCLSLGGVLNVLLNLFFTAACHLGIAGVALATVLSNVASLVLLLFILSRENEDIRFSLKSCRIDTPILKRILQIGLPSGLLGSIFSISNICTQTAVNTLGVSVIEASASAGNIEIYVQYLGNAFAQASTTMISQAYGAGKPKRCRQIFSTALPTCMGATLIISIIVYLLSGVILRIFTPDPVIIALAKERMQFTLLFKFIQCAMDISVGVMQGYEKTVFPACISLFGVCGTRLFWIFFVFFPNPTLSVLYVMYPITWLIASGANLAYYCFVQKNISKNEVDKETIGALL